ncbi:MAG: aldo/keto reductase [Candidatus Zipacnadales bacterium]
MRTTTRRQFLRHSGITALGAPFVLRTVPALAQAAGKKPDTQLTVKRRRLGRTELMVSEIGFGGHYKNPNRTYRIASIERALEYGINLFDCFEAPPDYREINMVGDALDFLGAREEVIIAAHLWTFGRFFDMGEIDKTLRMLRTDRIDIGWLTALHLTLTDEPVEVAMKAKEQGKLRFIGVTGHEKTQVIETLRHGDVFDVMLFPYSYGVEGGTAYHFPMGKQRDMGIIGIKPFAGGSLFRAQRKIDELLSQPQFAGLKPAPAFLKYILQNQDLSATIPGMTTAAQVDENVQASVSPRFHAEEYQLLEKTFAVTKSHMLRQYPFLGQWMT